MGIIWGVFCERWLALLAFLSPLSTQRVPPTPTLPLPVCPMLAAGCPGLALWSGAIFPLLPPSPHSLLYSPLQAGAA